jgi:hypothetical protein
MWRPYLIYVFNALKVLTLGVVAVAAWYLTAWILGGDFGRPFGSYEPRGLSTAFLGLFVLLLGIGIAIVTPFLWGWRRKTPDSGDSFRGNTHDGI